MKIACSHCHLEFEKEALFEREIDGKKYYFCCKGCEGVFMLLHSQNLDSFYERLGKNRLEPPKENLGDTSRFDTESYKREFIRQKGEFFETSLIIEGIHCAACVWLNEKILYKQEGIIEANINYTNNKATIIWDPKKIKLSRIIEVIRSIGYDAKPYNPLYQEKSANLLRRDYYTKMIVALFCTMNIMWVAIPLYLGYFSGMKPEIKDILHFAEFVLATPALFYSGQIFFKGAWVGLKNRFINMDLLVISGATLVYFYSIYAAISGVGETYFESSTMIITFVLIGKFLEVRGKKSAADTIDRLNSQIPSEIVVLIDNNRIIKTPEEVEIGDLIELKAGEKAVIDGVIIKGESSFDESSLSGESLPVTKKIGDEVVSGTINQESTIIYKATKSFSNSTLYRLISLIEESLTKKPDIENLANLLSERFAITILSISLLTFFGWYLTTGVFEKSFITAISVLIVACPCALALATPIASLVGLSSALERGVIFKESRMLEKLAKIDTLLVDKTGTLTVGKPIVIKEELFFEFDKALLYSLLVKTNHPIAKGVLEYLGKMDESEVIDFKEIKSKGISGVVNGYELCGGNLDFMRENGIEIALSPSSSVFYFAINKRLVAVYELEDRLKDGAKEAIDKIKALGINIIILSGDNQNSVQKVAKELEISEYKSNLKPLDKASFLDELHSKNKIVAFAGDGINDTLALSRSDCAIAMGNGTDIAISVGDVVILDDSLRGLADSLIISKRTLKNIKQNLAISFFYNVIAIPVAVAGYVIPVIAAAFMSLSSVAVVLNSLRISMWHKL